MSTPRTSPWPLVALFTAGCLAPYLLPTLVGRLDSGLPLSATQAGAVGSALLLSSAAAGFLFASRVDRIGARRLARVGLALAAIGYGGAALTGAVPAVVLGALLGGFGSGTLTAVAATRIATQPDPHRASALGLLGVSGLAGLLYLTLPHLGPGHGRPLLALALTALAVWPLTGRLPAPAAAAPVPRRQRARRQRPGRLRPCSGLVLVSVMPCWSLVQNSLWGVSGRIGLTQAHLTEAAVGVVFAVALGAALLGVLGARALGPRLGRALPIGAGTALIAGCVALSASATGPTTFAIGQIAWNTVYPVVMSYVIGLAASLAPCGRWAVLVGSAASLGTAAGPLTGSLLAARAGFPVMGVVLAVVLLLAAVPMTAVALRAAGRPLLPDAVRRRGVGVRVVEATPDAPPVPARSAFETVG
ncbi:MFS transporter [Streptomyces sp. NPDC059378]|uniref:MFS transporter n=1 Tax=Streptomyces sp. NPDC059378 TaxID=3346815 RepID=UPI0036C223BC